MQLTDRIFMQRPRKKVGCNENVKETEFGVQESSEMSYFYKLTDIVIIT